MYKVLVVDDERSIRLTIAEFLKRAGYQVFSAADGNEASALLNQEEFDVGIFDINLPLKSGVELLEELRDRETYIPVIMITGEYSLERVPELIRAGAYDFISKPVVKEAILKAVSRAAEKKQLVDEKRRLENEVKRHAEELEVKIATRTAELAEAHDFLNLVLNSSTEYAIMTVDTNGDISLFNRGAELIFGCKETDAVGHRPKELLLKVKNGDRVFLEYAREAERSGELHTEMQLQRVDGSEFTASVTMTPIRTLDRLLLGYLYIIRDLTAERQAEALLRQMQARLERHERIAELGRVAAQIAHEVKNPLAGLLLYTMHLKDRASGKLEPGDLSIVDNIIQTINHLATTVEQILHFARPMALAPVATDLNQVIREVLRLLQPQLAAKRIESIIHAGAPSMIGLIDEPSMRAALMNFALNSIQAMADGGRLSITTRKSEHKIQVEISDTGAGMTEDQAAKVFEPFFTTKSQGLGLGMPYSKKVINQHGGTVKIKSHFGDGTSVYIDLPDEWGKS